MKRPLVALVLVSALYYSPSKAKAWGRRGHAAIAETAAMIAADRKPDAKYLRERAFDLGYYANVPDLVWKKPETYQAEWTNHFIDLEIFERAFKSKPAGKHFEMERSAFDAKFPEIDQKAGRVYWRIRELAARLDELVKELNEKSLSKERRHALQADWLVIAGVIGHYVADLSQPLHVTENYDGQLSGQKGIHSYFETDVIDDYPPGEIESEIGREAKLRAPAFFNRSAKKSLLVLLEELAESSNKRLPELLRIDKRVGRTNTRRARMAYTRMHVERMAQGSLYLAEIWLRASGWKYDGERFFTFISTPEFIAPGPPQVPTEPPADTTKRVTE